MTPAVAAALCLRRAEQLAEADGVRVELAARNGSIAHVFVGPLTRSGLFGSAGGSTLCRARARRLRVVGRRHGALDLRGRRVCYRCVAGLLPRGLATQPLPANRSQKAVVLDGLRYEDLAATEHLVATVAESHEYGAVVLFAVPPEDARRRALDAKVNRHRDQLRTAERTPDEIHAARTRREMQAAEAERIRLDRIREQQTDRHHERLRKGQYTTAREQALAAQHA